MTHRRYDRYGDVVEIEDDADVETASEPRLAVSIERGRIEADLREQERRRVFLARLPDGGTDARRRARRELAQEGITLAPRILVDRRAVELLTRVPA
jgi:hypothetical protein